MNSLRSKQTIIEPIVGLATTHIRILWQYRELMFFFIWRDIKVRYKQTVLGVAWVVLQPMASMLIFSGLFGIILQVPTGGIPYPLFVLCGLIPWQYFSSSLNKVSNSIVDSTNLITKIFFPRIMIPLSAIISGLVDFLIASIVLTILLIMYQTPLTFRMLFVPFLLIYEIMTAFGFGLWFAALNVRYRDIKHLMPFLIQVWMYLTPVVYGTDIIPQKFRWLLSINPLTGVIDGFRWAILNGYNSGTTQNTVLFVMSISIALLVFLSGVIYFSHTEKSFADII